MSDELAMSGKCPEDMTMEDFKGKLFEMMDSLGAKPILDEEIPLEVSLRMADSAMCDTLKGICKWLDATDEEMNKQIAPAKEIVNTIVNSEADNGSELIIRFGFAALEIIRLLAHFKKEKDNPTEESTQNDESIPEDKG